MALIWLFNTEGHLITRRLFKHLLNKYPAYLSCYSSSRLFSNQQLSSNKNDNNQIGHLNFKNSLRLSNTAPNKPDNKSEIEKLFKLAR